ncbi:hypothetical protein [Streptomyces sp. NPDC057426]|uniref:hypothetical protein n=1 Tax=Streptomyces sp. NPDC057426 TaxID=3346128 RepID=UPI0036A5C133
MNPLTHTERAQYFAAVHNMGHGEEIRDQAFMLAVEVMAQTPAPWDETEPFAAERYLAARGATPSAAAQNAIGFELGMRALHALATGSIAMSFEEIARWIETSVDGAQ